MIKHYESLGIDAANKTLLFSDSLDFDRADKLTDTLMQKLRLHLE